MYETSWDVYLIEYEKNIGNLMGAIYGVDHRGFIGEVYKLLPFPQNRDGFKQKPEGFKNRSIIKDVVQKYAKRVSISLMINEKDDRIHTGEYIFSRASFQDLIRYIWQGGYPRWKDDIRPDYLLVMKAKIEQSYSYLFEGLILK